MGEMIVNGNHVEAYYTILISTAGKYPGLSRVRVIGAAVMTVSLMLVMVQLNQRVIPQLLLAVVTIDCIWFCLDIIVLIDYMSNDDFSVQSP